MLKSLDRLILALAKYNLKISGSVLIYNRRSTPVPNEPGVYIFIEGDVITYVGQATNIYKRITATEHPAVKKADPLNNKVRIFWVLLKESSLTAIESGLIRYLKPKYNQLIPNKSKIDNSDLLRPCENPTRKNLAERFNVCYATLDRWLAVLEILSPNRGEAFPENDSIKLHEFWLATKFLGLSQENYIVLKNNEIDLSTYCNASFGMSLNEFLLQSVTASN
jgi:hypothetical protein